MDDVTSKRPWIPDKRWKKYGLMRVSCRSRNFPFAQFNYGHVEEVNEVNNRWFHTLFNQVRNISHARFTNFSALLLLPLPPSSPPAILPSCFCAEKFPRLHTSLSRTIGLPLGRNAALPCADRPRKSLWNFEPFATRKHKELHSTFLNFQLSESHSIYEAVRKIKPNSL